MTNYEAIKAMDKNKLAKWLALVIGCDVFPTARETCDNCQDVLLDWLEEHSEGQTINISNANVVIID